MSGMADGAPEMPGEIVQRVADEVRAERARQRLSQAQLMDAAGVTKHAVQRLEAGDAVDLAILDAVCRAMSIRVTDMIARAEGVVGHVTTRIASPNSAEVVKVESDGDVDITVGDVDIQQG